MVVAKLCGDTFACKNGSCKEGDGVLIEDKHKHLSLLSSVTSDVDGKNYYCECLSGFIGHDCSVEVKGCTSHREDLVHSCYYGSECIEAVNEYGLLDKFCDCSRARKEKGTFVSGLMCQYTSSIICVDGDEDVASTTDAYCMNGGTCQRIVSPEERFPGCRCEEGKWEGKHCEFLEGILKDDALDMFSVRKDEILYEQSLHGLGTKAESNFNVTSFGIGFGVMLGLGISLLMTLVLRRVTRKKKLHISGGYEGFVYDGQAPPPNVFSSSRKRELEEADDESTIVFESNLQDERYRDDVELLDEATSKILESQFSNMGVGGAEFNEEIRVGPSSQDATSSLPRITVKNGQFPLCKCNEISSTTSVVSHQSNIMSLDGNYSDDDDQQSNIVSLDGNYSDEDDQHSNIVSLDGNYSDKDHVGNTSNYRVLSFV